MAIIKVITDTDLGAGLAIVANKVVPVVDGTSIQLNGSNELSTVINPDVINDLVTLSGVAANSSDLGTFTGSIVPDAQNIKAAIQALETAVESINIAGEFAGSAATFAALPVTTTNTITGLTNPVNNGDWAILTADDGGNQSGIYAFDGANYVLAKEIPEVFALVVETADSNSIALTGDGNTGTELTANLIVDTVVTDNLVEVTGDGVRVTGTAVKALFPDFAHELQDLASNTLGFISDTATISV